MKFGPMLLGEAEGAILAHAVKQGGLVLKKGTVLDSEALGRLADAGVTTVVAALLEAEDVGEDAAAARLAVALAGTGVRIDPPATGRTNLYAEAPGVLLVDAARVDDLNAADEAITAATLPAFKAVVAGEMIGTIKIIPFSVPNALLARAEAIVAAPALRVAPFRGRGVTLISTLLPGLKPSVVDKTLAVMRERLLPMGARVEADVRVSHDVAALTQALKQAHAAEFIIVFGASAITDRLDVIPAALERAGGIVEHFGMPVDPGNLLMIGRLGTVPVLGAPGCARSPRENGFDWVLQRLMADIPVTRADIQKMGVGGLLMEIVSRPQLRDGAAPLPLPVPTLAPPPVAVVLLAAGRSTRMGGPNKLLALYNNKPLVRHAAEAALVAEVGEVLVVLGHQDVAVKTALAGLPVRFIANPAYAEGLSTSLKAGVLATKPEVEAVIVALGDMPLVGASVIRRLAGVFYENPGVKAVIPTSLGERGNPVLVARGLFDAVSRLEGDIGARKLIEAAGADVVEVPVDDAGIHRDIDTPEALNGLKPGA